MEEVSPLQLVRLTTAVLVVGIWPPLANGQTPEPASSASSETSGARGIFKGIIKSFGQPLHPIIQTIASGGGLGGGIGYTFPTSDRWNVTTKALATPNKYWETQFDGVYSVARGSIAAYARARDMNRLNFFGPGSETQVESRSTYTLRDPVAGVFGSVKVAPGIAVGGRFEEVWPRVGSGREERLPSIEQRFGEPDAPGLTTWPRFGRYQAFVEAVAPAAAGWALNQGGRYRISYDIFDDQDLGRFDFDRLQIEGRHTFALPRPYHSVTLHGWVSSSQARAGRTVPFYLQQTLGGTSNLRSLHDQLIGSDGTAGTLRGFANLRFRDDHLLLLQAEYRIPIWGPLDATVFADAGKAVSQRSALTLADLKKDYGFSLSLMRGAATRARVDVGLGGGEGTHIFINVAGMLQ